jgi:hypothetical protein
MMKNMIGLAPGVTTTFSAPHGMPRSAFQRVDRGLANEARRVEVGLADFEMNDLLPLLFERARALQHLERGLGSQATHALRERHWFLRGFSAAPLSECVRAVSSRVSIAGAAPCRPTAKR